MKTNANEKAQKASKLTSEVIVEDATETDIEAVLEIYAHHVLNGLASFEEEPPSLDEMRARRAQVARLGLPYLVAKRDGRVVGYAYASPYRARSAYRFAVENSVYVRDEVAGTGIGGALLDALIARCENGPWRQMVAIIGDSGNDGSVALHRSRGFRKVGTLLAVGFKQGRWVDSVLMQRELGAGSASPPRSAAGGEDKPS
ncbi:MAG: N-acetyltransferase [Hyphomicrobiales bacterium]|nr:N-acetyltransferase [Hyphomicrobiales bacterium]